MSKELKSESGFTLVEVMIAIIILSFGVVGFNLMQVRAIKGNSDADRLTSMAMLASDKIEKFIAMDYDTFVAEDGTGLNDDYAGLNDGLPDDDPDTDDTTSDGEEDIWDKKTGDSPLFTLRWNVAVDFPVVNNTTVRIIVIDNWAQKALTFDYTRLNTVFYD